jgi:hypothetical protein
MRADKELDEIFLRATLLALKFLCGALALLILLELSAPDAGPDVSPNIATEYAK